MLAHEAKKPLALRRVLEADTRTRTGDPFITRYGPGRPPTPIAARCLSRLRSLASLPASRVCHPIRRDSVGLRAPGARSSVGNAETPLIRVGTADRSRQRLAANRRAAGPDGPLRDGVCLGTTPGGTHTARRRRAFGPARHRRIARRGLALPPGGASSRSCCSLSVVMLGVKPGLRWGVGVVGGWGGVRAD